MDRMIRDHAVDQLLVELGFADQIGSPVYPKLRRRLRLLLGIARAYILLVLQDSEKNATESPTKDDLDKLTE